MAVQLKFFIIPIQNIQDEELELNKFLSNTRVINIKRDFVDQGQNSFWQISVEYQQASNDNQSFDPKSGKRIDYRDVLSQEDFTVFARLREWRKNRSKEENIPAYTIFTNEQLAAISKKRVTTKTDLGKIDGIGDSRVNKYSEEVLKIISEETAKQKNFQKSSNPNKANENQRYIQRNL